MENPDVYKTANGLQRRSVHDVSDEFREKLEAMSGRCLDIGSGPGDAIVDFILPKLNPKATVVCSDISESMVNFGKERYSDDSRLSFIQLDIESHNVPENLIGWFDNVTSFYCLHWCQNMRQVFENIFKLLRSGGTALMTFVARSPIFDSYKYLAEDPRYQPYMKDADRYVPVFQYDGDRQNALQTLIREVGFEISHCSVRKRSHTFDTHDAFAQFALALNPFVERMPYGLKEEYKKDLAETAIRCNDNFNEKGHNINECGVSHTNLTFLVYLRKPLIN